MIDWNRLRVAVSFVFFVGVVVALMVGWIGFCVWLLPSPWSGVLAMGVLAVAMTAGLYRDLGRQEREGEP